MEKIQFDIRSDQDAFDFKRSDSEILISGISVALDEVIELTSISQGYSSNLVDSNSASLRIVTKRKQVTINQGNTAYLGVSWKKESGAALFLEITSAIIKAVKPRLLYNVLKSLNEGNSLLVGPFKITKEGLFTKKLFSDKFFSWDWNIQCDGFSKPHHILSPYSGHSRGVKLSFINPSTGLREELGFLKHNEDNSTTLISLCLLLGERNDEYLYSMFQTGEEAESGGIPHIKRNLGVFKNMPESALKRRLGKRLPEIL